MLFRRIMGRSMLPGLRPGAVVVARKRLPHVGEMAIATLHGRQVVKRVTEHSARGYFLVGDNRLESTDSREYGPVKAEAIMGTVVAHLPSAEPAKPATHLQRFARLVFAACFVVLAVAQLVGFEEFAKLLSNVRSMSLGDGYILAASIVTLEVFALPFLFFMSLSRAFRFVSQVCGGLAIILWAYIALQTPGQVPLLSDFTSVSLPGAGGFIILLTVLLIVSTIPLARLHKNSRSVL